MTRPNGAGHLGAAACGRRTRRSSRLAGGAPARRRRAPRDRRQVAEGLGEDDAVLGGHRGALAGRRRWRVRGVADDDHRSAMPDRHVAEVVGVVAGQLELAGPDQVDGRPGVIPEQLDELLASRRHRSLRRARRGRSRSRGQFTNQTTSPPGGRSSRRTLDGRRSCATPRARRRATTPCVMPPKFVSPT